MAIDNRFARLLEAVRRVRGVGRYPHLRQEFYPEWAGSDSGANDFLYEMSSDKNMVQDAAELVPELVESLERAVRWLRRLEGEYPGCLNPDAIEKHLMPAITKAIGN